MIVKQVKDSLKFKKNKVKDSLRLYLYGRIEANLFKKFQIRANKFINLFIKNGLNVSKNYIKFCFRPFLVDLLVDLKFLLFILVTILLIMVDLKYP